MFCTHCGQRLSEDARFCIACGKPVIPGRMPGASAQPNNAAVNGARTGTTSLSGKIVAIIVVAAFVSVMSLWFSFRWFGGLSGTYRYYGNDFVFDTITFSRTGRVEATGGYFADSGVVGRYSRTKGGYFVDFTTTSDGSIGTGRGTLLVTDFYVSKKGPDVVTVEILTSSSLSANWYFVKRDFVK